MTLREITVDKKIINGAEKAFKPYFHAGWNADRYGKERKRNGDTYGKYCGI